MQKAPPLFLVLQMSVFTVISSIVVFCATIFALWGLWYAGIIATYEPLLGHAVVTSVIAGAAIVYLTYLMSKEDTELTVTLKDERKKG